MKATWSVSEKSLFSSIWINKDEITPNGFRGIPKMTFSWIGELL